MAAKVPQRAVITGAASGLGCALSEELARRGSALLLLDVNEDSSSYTEVLTWLVNL